MFRKVSMVRVVGAPAICATVSTLPTRSTTAIVDGLPRALASLIACNTIRLTSSSVRFGAAPVGVGAAGLSAIDGVKSPPAPPPPQPDGAAHHSASIATAARNAGCANRLDWRRAVIVQASSSLPLPPDGVRAAPDGSIVTRTLPAVQSNRRKPRPSLGQLCRECHTGRFTSENHDPLPQPPAASPQGSCASARTRCDGSHGS